MPARPTNPARQSRTVALLLAAAFALALLASIVWATMKTDVVAGLAYLAADRWGVVTLIDVYAGAFVVAAWMWVCERRLVTWLVWVVALLCLGHFVSAIYLLVRLCRAPTLSAAFQPYRPAAG